MYRTALSVAILASPGVFGQTQIDLRVQARDVDFSGASFTRPLQTGSSLPSTCQVGAMFFKTNATAGGNLYGCTATNQWTAQAGVGNLTVSAAGTTVGAATNMNFAGGFGELDAISQNGSQVNVQQSVDTSVVPSKSAIQSGSITLCTSASGSGVAYTCAMSPTLGTYSAGMVIEWKPDVNATGSATTLNIDTLGPMPIFEADGLTNPTSADVVAGHLYQLWYDGAKFRLMTTAGAGTGTLQFDESGTSIGSGTGVNFTGGFGELDALSENGSVVNIQQSVDTSVITSLPAAQAGKMLLCQSASGSPDNYTCSLSPTLTAYTQGMVIHWIPDVTGIGGVTTLNIDTLGAVPVFESDGMTAPTSADILAGRLYGLWYDGTNFRLMTPPVNVAAVGAQPACTAALRGLIWQTLGGSGVKDMVSVCAKDSSDVSAWRSVY